MFPRNIHTFLGQNCTSNRRLQKLDVLFASLTEFREVEGGIVSIWESCAIIELDLLLCAGCSGCWGVPKASQASRDGRNSPSYILFLCLTRTQKRNASFYAIEATKINQIQIHPVQETMNSAGSEALG